MHGIAMHTRKEFFSASLPLLLRPRRLIRVQQLRITAAVQTATKLLMPMSILAAELRHPSERGTNWRPCGVTTVVVIKLQRTSANVEFLIANLVELHVPVVNCLVAGCPATKA